MPETSGRSGRPGNLAESKGSGRTGTPGNKESVSVPSRPGMSQTSTRAGRTLAPGNTSSAILPSRNPGTMKSKTGSPSGDVPGKSTGKFHHKDSGLLKR
jgi:hypothetical protein